MNHHTAWKARIVRLTTMAALTATVVTLAISSSAPALANIGASNFESNDGNLKVDTSGATDWNSFSPTWTGTAPYRQAATTANGWTFAGFEDAQKTNTDTGFAGGTKQDVNCPSVIGTSSPNKADLKRIYLASKIGSDGHVYLTLAWVRIPQNTTSPSAHVGFEFNQGETACGTGSDGLVNRTVGDMLIVYDFTGGATDHPTITLRRWTDTGPCEISNDPLPCWGVATDLTASGFADAAVNTTASVLDTAAPTSETLGINEFGEAGVDLTSAGVFSANQCTSFGSAEGVSRSSGNSGTAAMEDLVGPGTFTLANCGRIIIRKVTSPSPDPTNSSFSYTTTGGLSPATFSLKNGGSKDYGSSVPQGSYSVTEADPSPNFVLTKLDCSASSLTHGSTATPSTSTRTVTIVLKPQDTVDCTYTNTLQQGAIKITKTSSKAAATALAGAHFEVCTNAGPYTTANPCVPATGGSDLVTGSAGTVCLDQLSFGTYYVQETAAPSGYAIDKSSAVSAAVNVSAKCSDATFVGQSLAFTDTPLTDILVSATSEATGGTKTTITCVNSSNANVGNSPQGPLAAPTVTATALLPGTYTCTIVVDP